METVIKKPIKRDPNLVPLSREHHFGLLFCWKIKQGLAKSIPFFVIRKYVLNFWKNNLQEHLETEERIIADILPPSDPHLKQFHQEHLLIRDLIAQVETNEQLNVLLFEALHTLVSEHIRFEEREFFPHLEYLAGPDKLQEIGELLASEHHQPTDDFEPAFWENKPVAAETQNAAPLKQ